LCAVASDAPPGLVAATESFGIEIGTALQMLDDLGSLTSAARREKGREDLRNHRPTWPWAWLAEERPFMWGRVVEQVKAARDDHDLDAAAAVLTAEIGELGRARIRTQIDGALADLVGRGGNASAIAAIGAALSRMEKSYD
jgi:geranylgeranyl pyrophosphate synthase